MKKGAIHIDWVISIGIFFIYLIILLVLIKPTYKPEFESSFLTEMVKDEFLKQNKINAGFIIFIPDCEGNWYAPEIVTKINENLEEENPIREDEIYVNPEPITIAPKTSYKAYFLEDPSFSSNFNTGLGTCDTVEIGEVFFYNGLKETLDFNNEDFTKFPESKNYKITIYGLETPIDPFDSGQEPSTDDNIHVLDWSTSILKWDIDKIKRENIIMNIWVW